MKRIFQNFMQYVKKHINTIRRKKNRCRIEYCIKGSNITYEDLIPIADDDYKMLVQELERKVNQEIPDEPEFKTEPWVLPNGKVVPGAPLRNIYAWGEIIDSMKRHRDAYYINNRPCGKCGADKTVFFLFRSSKKSWEELCGREGYMLICPDCLTIIGLKWYLMN